MRPVVNGLEEEYGEQIEFRIHNIRSPEGESWASQYNLRGHPAFLLLNSQGQEQWRYIGTISHERIVAEFQNLSP